MARIPKIWFRKDRKAWFVTVRGVRHNLGPDKKAASDRFHQLMREPDRKPVRSMSFVAIADAFLDWVQTHRAKKTYEDTRYYIQSFCRMYPELMPVDLRPFHCERWADSRGNISQSTRRNYLRSIKRVVNWANQQGYLDIDPLKGMQIPAYERREVCLSRDEFETMLRYVDKDWFRRLCMVAFETGCRPQELTRVEARHFDAANSRWVFPVNESKGKRQPRVIYLTPAAEKITRDLVEQHPDGPLFCNAAGRPLKQPTIASAFRRIRVLMGRDALQRQGIGRNEAVKQELLARGDQRSLEVVSTDQRRSLFNAAAAKLIPKYCLYSLRHSFATNALQSGLDGLTVAILLGHRDPSMLARVYQHMAHNPQHLLGQVRKATND